MVPGQAIFYSSQYWAVAYENNSAYYFCNIWKSSTNTTQK